MPVFYEVAELDQDASERFAVIRIDTDAQVGPAGCQGLVVTLHTDEAEAIATARALRSPLN